MQESTTESQTKFSGHKEDKQEDNSCRWERKGWKTSKEQCETIAFSTGHCKDPGEPILVRILTLHWLLPVFSGPKLQAPERVRFKVSTRILRDFLLILILVSCGLFKVIAHNSLLENPWECHQPWEVPKWWSSFEGRCGGVQVGVEEFAPRLRTIFSTASVDCQ